MYASDDLYQERTALRSRVDAAEKFERGRGLRSNSIFLEKLGRLELVNRIVALMRKGKL
jgi:hypothetical protein